MTKPILITFSGLPGVGKSTLATALAQEIGAVYLAIDPIEAAIQNATQQSQDTGDTAYRVMFSLADLNLGHGLNVVGDSVNPVAETRNGWRRVAHIKKARLLEIEVICSDPEIHQNRVSDRRKKLGGRVPTWVDVAAREYTPYTGNRLIVDTATHSIEAALDRIISAIF